MGCEQMGDITICGNFADLLPEKPKDFDFDRTAKWLEPYPFDIREVIGGTVCNCKVVKAHYAPYYGFDYYHQDSCFIMQKYRNTPNAEYFWSMQHLPAIAFGENAVPVDTPPRMYIRGRSTAKKIRVRRGGQVDTRNLQLAF
jgi:hypothetical protein